jgi:hypothetical protein
VWKYISMLSMFRRETSKKNIWGARDAICINQGAEYVWLHTLICYVGWTSHRSRSQRIKSAGTASQMYILHSCRAGCIYHHLAHYLILFYCSFIQAFWIDPIFCPSVGLLW